MKEIKVKEEDYAYFKNYGKIIFLYKFIVRDTLCSISKKEYVVIAEDEANYYGKSDEFELLPIGKNKAVGVVSPYVIDDPRVDVYDGLIDVKLFSFDGNKEEKRLTAELLDAAEDYMNEKIRFNFKEIRKSCLS